MGLEAIVRIGETSEEPSQPERRKTPISGMFSEPNSKVMGNKLIFEKKESISESNEKETEPIIICPLKRWGCACQSKLVITGFGVALAFWIRWEF